MSVGSTTVAVAVTSTSIVVANGGRRLLVIVNDSDTDIYLALGEAAVVGEGIRLNAAGGTYTSERKRARDRIFTGEVFGIHGGAATKDVTIQELDEGE